MINTLLAKVDHSQSMFNRMVDDYTLQKFTGEWTQRQRAEKKE